MTNINNLFTNEETINKVPARGLHGTAELTALSSQYANAIINTMNEDADEYADRIQQSMSESTALNNLIVELIPGGYAEEASFLKELDDATVDSMLKSQQSKRSRAKGKFMTLDNYKVLMTAAIAEFLIREVTDRVKTSGGGGARYAELNYTIERLEQLAEDQDALKREIRNIQSKKSIMKGKADFDPNSERWIQLCSVEQQLKDMRTGAAPSIVEIDKTRDELKDLLSDTDIDKLKSAEAHELLKIIAGKIAD